MNPPAGSPDSRLGRVEYPVAASQAMAEYAGTLFHLTRVEYPITASFSDVGWSDVRNSNRPCDRPYDITREGRAEYLRHNPVKTAPYTTRHNPVGASCWGSCYSPQPTALRTAFLTFRPQTHHDARLSFAFAMLNGVGDFQASP